MTTLPGLAHLHPLVRLGLAMKRRGHDVLMASAASFLPRIAATGLAGVAAGMDYRIGAEERLVPSLARARECRDRSFPYTRVVYVETVGRRMLPDLKAVARTWRPDVVVRDSVDFASCFVAEAAGIPHATGRENRFLSIDGWRAETGDALDELAALAGVETADAAALLYRHLGLAPALPSFVRASDLVPDDREFGSTVVETMRFVRPELFDGTLHDDVLPARVWTRRPLVYASLGTVYNRRPELLASMLESGRGAPFELVVAVGSDQDPRGFERRAHNVHVVQYVALSRILPHCSAVMTAGGQCTIMAALAHGLPLVVVPLNADHPTNASRCARLGVGVAVSPADATPATLRTAMTAVLDDPSFRQRAGAMQAEYRSLPGVEHAVDLVEALVSP